MNAQLAPLYTAHLATLSTHADLALALGGFDHLLIAAGTPLGKFLDDQDYPFVANPHFRHWLPLADAPGSWIAYTPGSRPKLVFVQPRDYWHVVPQAPHGYWVEHLDIVTVRSAEEAVAHLPKGHSAVVAPACPAIDGVTTNNPQPVLD
ncbi:MAG: Xaa-Pro dipeptidase, partial [Xanthomonadaceae bacterium]|nr:Xaa-Pro dipeptidase [Xanthomonadaceae bacterium]